MEGCLNRIEIFRQLTIDDLEELNMSKFECLLDPHYDEFVMFCEVLKDETDVKNVSCYMIDSNIEFEITKIDDSKKKINF